MTKYLITSALPYINGIKHIGNLVGSMLPSDVYNRFLRQLSKETLFICGTDEHGTPAEIASIEANMDTREYCDQMHNKQKDLYQKFSIDFDFFGRSSSISNQVISQEIYKQLVSNGCIEIREIEQYYSIESDRFLPDRYVVGECPYCNTHTRGDQCDGCGSLLESSELINPLSSIDKSHTIILKKTTHSFLNVKKVENQLRDWIEQKSEWSNVVSGIAKKWLKDGLRPRCITRDLKWGIPAPEWPDKVFYVWFDAPNAYISITMDYAISLNKPDMWKDWWLDHDNVIYTEFMAKDNVPFHTIFWPSILMAAGNHYKLVDNIKGFNWLTFNKSKFSTSQKNGIFIDQALDLYPADYWRYYLMSNCPEGSDSDFSFDHFASIVNKDLCNVLGNFIHRTLSFMHTHYNDIVPISLDNDNLDNVLNDDMTSQAEQFIASMNEIKFRQAMQILRSIWCACNIYIDHNAPWQTISNNPEQAALCITHCLHLINFIATLSWSIIPTTSEKIYDMLNHKKDISDEGKIIPPVINATPDFSCMKSGHTINAITPLFVKIDNIRIEELMKTYQS